MAIKKAKMAISQNSFNHLKTMSDVIKKDFKDGSITTSDLNSWIINWFFKNHFSKQIKTIKDDHRDPIKQLQSIIKAFKSGQSISDIDHKTLLKNLAKQKKHAKKTKDINQ